MPLIRWTLTLLISLLALPRSAGAIVNGSFDGAAHPYAGTAAAGDAFCSGSLVTPTVFVTAGHCTAAFAGSGETTFVTFDAHARPTSDYVTGRRTPIRASSTSRRRGRACRLVGTTSA